MSPRQLVRRIISFTILPFLASSGLAGSISGKITLDGKPPPETPIEFNPECKAMHTAHVTTKRYVVDAGGGLANVFVYIKEGLKGKKFPPPATAVILDQKACMYDPYVLGIQTGQKLVIQNSDAFMHNVSATPDHGKNDSFNIAQANKGDKTEQTFSKPEVFVKFSCQVHNWMYAYLGVVDHPYFAVSAADGAFKLADVPDGEYTVAAVHPKIGSKAPQTVKVKVAAGDAKADFVFKPKAE